jgi:TonB family protein
VALPPPPPPPKKPPEPEPMKQEPQKTQDLSKPSKVIENKPAAKPNPAPAGSPLTAAAGAGANAYGLAVGNGGGGGMIGGGGGGGGGGGSRFGAYAGTIQARIEAALHDDERTRSAKYLLKLSIWLSPTGQVVRVKVASSTGDPALDQAIERVIAAVGVGQAPPNDMPQPVNLQVRARTG